MQRNIALSYSVELSLLSKLLDGLPLNGDEQSANACVAKNLCSC